MLFDFLDLVSKKYMRLWVSGWTTVIFIPILIVMIFNGVFSTPMYIGLFILTLVVIGSIHITYQEISKIIKKRENQ